MYPSSERGTEDPDRRIQGVQTRRFDDMEKSRLSPNSDRGAKGSERGTQGDQSRSFTQGYERSQGTGNRGSPTVRHHSKPHDKYGDLARINNINSSTIDYSNKSKNNNDSNNSIIKMDPNHPADPYSPHHGCYPGVSAMPDRYRYRHRHCLQGENQDGGRGVEWVGGDQHPHHAQSDRTRQDGYPKLKYRKSNDYQKQQYPGNR